MKLPERWKHERDKSLKALGMRDYVDYLASPLWARIRRRVYGRAKGMCESKGCTRVAVAIHHWSYALKTMRGDSIARLQAACESCHKRHHSMRENPKRQASRARRRAFKSWVAAGGAVGRPQNQRPRLVKST